MRAIAPNWLSMRWFIFFATSCGITLQSGSGMFPLGRNSQGRSSGLTALLVLGNGALLAALVIGTGFYGYNELRWSTLVVVTGLIVLFAPGLFEEWRWSIGNIKTHLTILVGVPVIALLALNRISGMTLPFVS